MAKRNPNTYKNGGIRLRPLTVAKLNELLAKTSLKKTRAKIQREIDRKSAA